MGVIPVLIVAAILAVSLPLLWTAHYDQKRLHEGTVVLRPHIGLRMYGLVFAVGTITGLTIAAICTPPRNEEVYYLALLYLMFAALGLPLLVESLRWGLMVTDKGLECHSPWRGRRFVPWEEVASVSFSHMGSWFIIRTKSGYRFRVPLMGAANRFLCCMEAKLDSSDLVNAYDGYKRIGRAFPAFSGRLDLDQGKKTWKRVRPGVSSATRKNRDERTKE